MLCEVSLGEIATEAISQLGPEANSDFVYVDIGCIDRERKSILAPSHLPYDKAPSRAKQVLKAGDVLVSMTPPNLNAVALVPDCLNGAIGSTGFHILRSKRVDQKFLYYLVQSPDFIDAMCGVVQGALYPAVRPRDISSFKFLLPSSLAQRVIVAKLEELLADLDAGVAELKAAQKKLAQYRQSLLKAAVEGALTAGWRERQKEELRRKNAEGNPLLPSSFDASSLLERILTERRARWEARQLAKFQEQGKTPPKDWQKKYPEPVQPDTTDLPELPEGWVWANVDQLSVVVRGASPRPAGDPRYFGGDIPWITVGSLTADDSMYLNAVSQFVTEAGRDASRFIDAGTLLLTNSGATLGVPKITNIGGCINDGSVALLDVDDPLKIYMYWYLRTQTAVLRATNQGAAQPNLNTDIVRRICVPVCPFVEMSQINSLLDAQVNAIEEQRNSIATSLKQSTAQRQNILRAAFAGQLVQQDPNDEPAGVLLERIRAERAESKTTQKPRGRKTKELHR